jgi:hypothetical protein
VSCTDGIPLVKRAVEKYRAQELTALYIGHQDRVEKLNRYAEDNGITDYLFDSDDSVSAKFGITYGGGIVLVNGSSRVKAWIPSGVSPARMDAEIQKILP